MNETVWVQSASQPWQASPSATVSRKRFHLVCDATGNAESGQVTSLVRYNRGARFNRHEHPDGEEILVLSGVFSDHTGDWGAGSYLLNPEGFSHAPFSDSGCLLLVKLRQYPGQAHVALQIAKQPSVSADFGRRQQLYEDGVETTSIVQLSGRYHCEHPGGSEGFVLTGTLKMDEVQLARHDWFRIGAGSSAMLEGVASLYLKEGGVARLRHST